MRLWTSISSLECDSRSPSPAVPYKHVMHISVLNTESKTVLGDTEARQCFYIFMIDAIINVAVYTGQVLQTNSLSY